MIVAPRSSTRITSKIVRVSRRGIEGWVLDTQQPGRKCNVEALAENGHLLGTALATAAADKGAARPPGKGFHYFNLTIPINASIGSRSVLVRDELTKEMLGSFALERFLAQLRPGCLAARQTHLVGWAIDCERLFLRPRLAVAVGDREIGIGNASLYRADLFRVGVGDGFAGFEIEKEMFAGVSEISIRETRSGTTLFEHVRLVGDKGQRVQVRQKGVSG
jgi:hypothetical protein